MQRVLEYLPEALESIWRNRTRSILTMLGMIIGIASVIAVLGLSQAASQGLDAQLHSGGNPGIIVQVDPSQDDPANATLYYRDVARTADLASGAVGSAVPFYNPNFRTWRVRGSGKPIYMSAMSTDGARENAGRYVIAGRLLDRSDVRDAASVCILSKSAAQKLFPGADAVGNTVNVNDSRLAVVGVYEMRGSLLSSLVGDTIEAPYSTFHLVDPGSVDNIQAWPARGVSTVEAIHALRTALHRIHGPHAKYIIQDQAAVLGIFGKALGAIGIGLTFIGGIALFVAGVGIMNIMLVSIAERTREIGIRKAIGASSGEIGTQFLVEATLLSLGGGFIGALLGSLALIGGSQSIARFAGSAPIPWLLVLSIAIGFSIAVGIGFGSYPALRAGRLDPVEALRS